MGCNNSLQQIILIITQIVSCIITSVGIFIALWQTKYPYQKKIKLSTIKMIKALQL